MLDDFMINQIFSDDIYSEFRAYCESAGFELVYEIEPVDIVAFRAKTNMGQNVITLIKNIISEINSDKNELIEGNDTNSLMDSTITSSGKFIGTNSNIKIEDLMLSVRSTNCLRSNGVSTLEELLLCTEGQLLSFKNLGVKCLNEIKNRLNSLEQSNYIPDINISNKKNNDIKVYVSDKLIIQIENLLTIPKYIIDNENFSMNDFEILGKVEIAIDTLDSAICLEAYLEPKKVLPIINSFMTFNLENEIKHINKKRLMDEFYKIPTHRYKNHIRHYITTYTKDVVEINLLSKLFENYEIIENMPIALRINSLDSNEFDNTLKFFKWLCFDIEKIILEVFYCFILDKRIEKILIDRANGESLEMAGSKHSITRERVRQIEKKAQKKFDYWNSRLRILKLLSADRNGDAVINKDKIKEFNLSYFELLIYLLKQSESKYYTYNKQLDVFILGDSKDYSKLDEFIIDLPEIILENSFDELIDEISVKTNAPKELIVTKLNFTYKLSGTVYSKNKLTLSKMYDITMEQFYPNGIKLFDIVEIHKFIDNYSTYFGKMNVNSTSRSIEAIIFNTAILCDRGTYIHKSYVNIHEDLINRIDAFIENSDRVSLSFLELFNRFKEELLLNSNVNNRYYLQGILKWKLKNKYFFSRDYISKIKNIDMTNEIDEFVYQKGFVSKREILEEFGGISEAMLAQNISRSSKIINLEMGYYLHESQLNLKESDWEISNLIKINIVQAPISSRKLLEIAFVDYSDFLDRNSIDNHSKLYGVLKYMFKEEYNFSRPYIGNINDEDLSTLSILKTHLEGTKYIEVSEVISICEDNLYQFSSWINMLKQLSDDYIRVDSNLLVIASELVITAEDIDMIKEILLSDIEVKGYISPLKIDNFIFYPDVGIKWTPFLLRSIVQKNIDEILIVEMGTSDTYFLGSLFVSSSMDIDDYDELLRMLILSENSRESFKNLNDIKSWLLEEGLINNEIPKSLFTKNYLYIDEYGKVIVI